MNDEDKPAENPQKKENTDTLAEKNFSDILFSEFNANISPQNSKKFMGVIDAFSFDFRDALESFLGQKLLFSFQDIQLSNAIEFELPDTLKTLTGFIIPSNSQKGLIGFGFQFLDSIINILYGGNSTTKASQPTLGKTGAKISERLSSTALLLFQKALEEVYPVEFQTLATSEQTQTMCNKYLPDYFFALSFSVTIQETESYIHILLPEGLLENIIRTEQKIPPNTSSQTEPQPQEQLKNTIIDSTITLIAYLDDIKMKINEVLSLKPGDMIPISNPSRVYLSHANKKIFKGTVGQADSNKVVKIDEPV